MMNKLKKITMVALMLMMLGMMTVPVVSAVKADTTTETAVVTEEDANAEETADDAKGDKAMAAAIAVGLAAAAGAIGMGMAIAKSADAIARQPEAEGKIRTTLMLGLVFVETAIIYALVIAILIIFVL